MKGNYLTLINNFFTFLGFLSLALYIISNLSNYVTVPAFIEYLFVYIFIIRALFNSWQLKNDIAIRLILLSIFLPLVFFSINYFSNSNLAKEYFLFENLLRLMTFSAIGYWLCGKIKYTYIFLLFTLACSIFALFNVDFIQNLTEILNGKRKDSGIGNSQYTANLFGLLIIGMICFYKDIAEYKKDNKIILSLYIIILSLCTTIFVGSQTRAGLIGMDIIYTFSIIHFSFLLIREKVTPSTKKVFYTYAIVFFIILSTSTYNIVNKRSVNDNKVVEQIVNKEFDSLKMTSLGIRINSWIEASNWIMEKPFHGWGGKANSHVFKLSNFPENIKANFGHFHNSYIELLLSYGIIGLSLIIYTFYWINRKAYLFSKENKKYKSIHLFTLYGTFFTLFINIFESYLIYSIGVYTTAILLAPTYAIYLSKLKKTNNK